MAVNSPEKALATYDALKSGAEFEFAIHRQGFDETITIVVDTK